MSESPIHDEQVAAYLGDHPDFFESRPDLLASMRFAPAHGNRAISLHERQLDVLRSFFTGQMPVLAIDIVFVALFLAATFAISPLLGAMSVGTPSARSAWPPCSASQVPDITSERRRNRVPGPPCAAGPARPCGSSA